MGFDDLKHKYKADADASHAAAQRQAAEAKTKKETDDAERKAWPAALEAAMPVIIATAEKALETLQELHIAPRLEKNALIEYKRPRDPRFYDAKHAIVALRFHVHPSPSGCTLLASVPMYIIADERGGALRIVGVKTDVSSDLEPQTYASFSSSQMLEPSFPRALEDALSHAYEAMRQLRD